MNLLGKISAFFLCLSLAGCSGREAASQKKSELEGQVSISGAFALYPLAVQWANEFQESNPGVKVDVSAGGAGKGMTDVLNGMVDFAMLSREIHDEESAQGALAFVVGRDAVVPDFNASNPHYEEIMRHGISASDARKIWVCGEYKTWGQLLGTSSKDPINVYTRSDACGAAQTFASWFGAKQEDLLGTAVYGDPGIATAVQADPLALGFNNLAYAYDGQTLAPLDGLAVLPVDSDGDGSVSEAENFYAARNSLMKAVAEDRYPSPPARNLYFVTKGVPADSASVAFLRYVMRRGQDLNESLGYVKISQKARTDNFRLFRTAERGRGSRSNNTDAMAIVFMALVLSLAALASGSIFIKDWNRKRIYRQKLSAGFMFALVTLTFLFLIAMVVGLYLKSLPILHENSLWNLLTSTKWKPSQGEFGFGAFIMGTVFVTILSVAISLPIALLTSVYLTEYSKTSVRKFVFPALDILAALPSVIYGVWGILVLIPVFGYSLLTAALVLCVMVLPIMISLFVEIFSGVPQELKDASTSLGATSWQTTHSIVLRKSLSGIFASVVLALSKAAGETIAVMMVCGSVPAIPKSIFEGFYTLPALIGNNYGEMASIPLYESAIMFAALLLMLIVLIFNVISRVILYRIEKKNG